MIQAIRKYISQVIQEMKQVKSPDRKRAFRLTLIVLATCGIIGAYIGLLDYGLTKFITLVI